MKTVALVCTLDNVEFLVDRDQAVMLKTIDAVLEDADADASIPISNVRSDIFQKILDFCQHELDTASAQASDPATWLHDYFAAMSHDYLFQFIMAVNFLNFDKLLNLACKVVADEIRGKSAEQIRQHFNIKDDFTEDKKETIRKEHIWCEQAFE